MLAGRPWSAGRYHSTMPGSAPPRSAPTASASLAGAVLIVADDLSGAADCAAAFASAGAHAFVSLDPLHADAPANGSVMAVDTDSRALLADEATRRVREAIANRPPGSLVYKKIDSTLRGHLAAELAAALDAMPEAPGAVLAPAFPQQGRTLVGGRCFVNGEPLEATALWRGAGIAGPADPVPRLQAEGLSAVALGPAPPGGEQALAGRIAEAFAAGARVAVCDASSTDELARLARALALLERAPLLAGSAGLARSLAEALGRSRGAATDADETAETAETADADEAAEAAAGPGRPVLTVIGSRAPVARAQAAAIVAATGALAVTVPVAQLVAEIPDAAAGEAIADALAAGRHAVLTVGEGETDLSLSLAIARGLARLAAPAARHAGGLVLTGGDTARAVLDALGAARIELLGEVEPGVPIARPREPVHEDARPGERSRNRNGAEPAEQPLLCLKAGGFGNANTLLHAVQALTARPPSREPSPAMPASLTSPPNEKAPE